jgi:hypothetical protein
MLTVVDAEAMTSNRALIDEIVRAGARWMLAAALEAEVNMYLAQLAQLADQRGEAGRRLVVRHGDHAERTVATAAGQGWNPPLARIVEFATLATPANRRHSAHDPQALTIARCAGGPLP